jgi:hypothetical protein
MVMRRHSVLLALALVTGAAGCSSFLATGARNLIELPIQSCDEVKLKARSRRRAEEAWEEVRKSMPDECWAKDYARGFKDGYADYLDYGGNGEPPATPPFAYRLRRYQTPQGLRDIEEWYAGFRHGSAVARTSGYRETNVIPLSSPPINTVERNPVIEQPPPLAPPPEPLPAPAETEQLNPPKKVSRSH